MGFAESLGNVEGNKRRALNVRTGGNTIGVASRQTVSIIMSKNFSSWN